MFSDTNMLIYGAFWKYLYCLSDNQNLLCFTSLADFFPISHSSSIIFCDNSTSQITHFSYEKSHVCQPSKFYMNSDLVPYNIYGTFIRYCKCGLLWYIVNALDYDSVWAPTPLPPCQSSSIILENNCYRPEGILGYIYGSKIWNRLRNVEIWLEM